MSTQREVIANALKRAHEAGDADAARKLAAAYQRTPADQLASPATFPDALEVRKPPQRVPEPGQPDPIGTAIGTGEAALTVGTGLTTGTAGMIGGMLKGMAEQILAGNFGTPEAADLIAEQAGKGAAALTYEPRTESGQRQTAAVGKAAENLAPLAAITPVEGALAVSSLASAARPVATAVTSAAKVGAGRVKQAIRPSTTTASVEPPARTDVVPVFDTKTVGRGSPIGDDLEIVNVNPKSLIKAHRATDPEFAVYDKVDAVSDFAKQGNKISLPQADVVDGRLSFTNGRNRAKLAEEAGLQSIPVAVSKGYGKEFTALVSQFDDAPRPGPRSAGAAGAGFGADSAGAAAAGDALIRETNAAQLPVPIKLTRGQKTREFGQTQFERETAKNAKLGEPLRERFETQNAQLQQNLDAFIDGTGGVAPDLRSVGLSVEKSLRARAARDKTRIRALYKRAEQTGELEAPVTVAKFIDHLNASAPEAEVANVLKAARAKAIQLGAATEENGQLVAQPVSLKNAELLRRSIGNATNTEPTNIRQASIMKGLLDEQTATAGGKLYQKARGARAKYARDYEDQLTIKNILGSKRGSSDRKIAYEDVLNRSIVTPSQSLDNVEGLFKVLGRSDAGKQAIADLKAGTLQWIKDEATKSVAINGKGDKIVSAAQLNKAINQLDKAGKLDFMFGKSGAEKLRTLRDVANDVLTVAPGTVNHSNTASAIAALMDVALSAGTGIPAPLASAARLLTRQIKDARLARRVEETLQ